MKPFRTPQSQQMESALVADCGSNITRVVLVEVVDNAYRFVARGESPSTAEAPFMDVTVGVINAIRAIEASTGRKFLLNGKLIVPQTEDGIGVDAFVASSSAAEPLRLVAAGLVRNLSAEAAARASHATYTTILDTISLDDYGDEESPGSAGERFSYADFDPDNPEAEFSPFTSNQAQPTLFSADSGPQSKQPRKNKNTREVSLFGEKARRVWRERQIAKLRRLSPNLIVLSGGVDGAPFEPLVELLDVILEANQQEAVLAMATGESRRPPTLVFAGNNQVQDDLLKKVGGQLECFLVDNIRPEEEHETLEPLQSQLSALYQERLLPGLPGHKQLAEMSQAPVNTTCRGVGLMTQYLARDVEGNRVLTTDLGGNNTALFFASASEFASMVRGDFGMSYGMSNVLAETGLTNVKRWLPFAVTEDEIIHYALNKTIRPHTLPADERERYIEAAFAREAIRLAYGLLAAQRPGGLDYNRIIGVGGPLISANPWHAALILLDSLQPAGADGSGLIELELDSTMLMSAAGTLAAYNPNAAAYVFRYDCLHRLGSVIVPVGEASLGSPAVTVTVRTKRGRARELTVPYGEIGVLVLHTDEQANLEIQPSKGFRIGSAAPGVAVNSQDYVSGGSVGLIIDARGRPIRFPANSDQRRETVVRWYSAYRNALQQAENEGPDDYSFPGWGGGRATGGKALPTPSTNGVAVNDQKKVEAEKEKPVEPVTPAAEAKTTFRPNTQPEKPAKIGESESNTVRGGRIRLPEANPEEPSPVDLLRQELNKKRKDKKKK